MIAAAPHWTASEARVLPLDAVRGAALFGVLMVNLVTDFRAPLVRYIALFHTEPGVLNRAVDLALGVAVESKAFALYAFLFGVGVALQASRVTPVAPFLTRRFAGLLALGVAHLTLVWNGDILTEYALCGLAMIPLVRRPPRVIVAASLACFALYAAPWPLRDVIPHGAAMERVAAETVRAYRDGTWTEALAFRARETVALIVPLLLQVFPRTLGLALLGVAAWRSALGGGRETRTRALRITRAAGLSVGGVATVWAAVAATRGVSFGRYGRLVDLVSTVPLALGYGAALWLAAERPRWSSRLAPLAAVGRMSLTNYLAQSVIFTALFNGYGFGLYARLGPASAALVGVCVYAAQAAWSVAWLRRHPIGPVERLWRAWSYGPRRAR